MTTERNTMSKAQNVTSVAEQYANHTNEQLVTQIKRYESTAATHKAKADRCWAYAVNGHGGHYYAEAREFYRRADENLAKAKELRAMLEDRLAGANAKAFVGGGGRGTNPSLAAAGKSAVIGAAISGAATVIDGWVNGDSPEEIAEHAVVNGATGGAASLAAHGASTVAGSAVSRIVSGTALGATVFAPVAPVAAAVVAGAGIGEVAYRVGKPLVEEAVDGILSGDPIGGIDLGVQMAILEAEDLVEETAEAIEEVVTTVVDGVRDFFSGLSCWLW